MTVDWLSLNSWQNLAVRAATPATAGAWVGGLHGWRIMSIVLCFLAGAGVFDFLRVLTGIFPGGVQIILPQAGVAQEERGGKKGHSIFQKTTLGPTFYQSRFTPYRSKIASTLTMGMASASA
jgi:hypothetical protein